MKKGEIWLVDLSDGKGHEQKGTRPCISLATANQMTSVIPLTKTLERLNLSFTFPVEPSQENGLTETSVALLFQITTLDQSRFIKQIGWIPKEQRTTIDELLKTYFKITE